MVKKGRPLCREHVKCRRLCLLLEIIAGKGQKANRMGKKRRYIHRLPCNIIFHGNVWIDASVMQMRMLCRSDEENRGGVTKMSKAVKKKSRRMWRTMRKTLGALFLVSALVIAAIPVDNLQASGTDEGIVTYADTLQKSITHETNEQDIPQINETTKIYTSGETDNAIQFAYLPDAVNNWGAVIVGYSSGQVEDNSLDFTQPVDAYGQYRINNAGGYNYVAVGKKGNFLFYRETEQVDLTILTGEPEPDYGIAPDYCELVSEKPLTDDDGNVTGKVVTVKKEKGEKQPCYNETYDVWSKISDENLYYDAADDKGENPNNPNPNYQKVGRNQDYQRIQKVPITYISNQYIEVDDNKKWVYGGTISDNTKEKGIFAGQTNVKTLTVSEKFKGIGDYAFYSSGLREITLANGLTYIGKGAFESCRFLAAANLDVTCILNMLGEGAFRDCVLLTKFVLPEGVMQIGDSAFENCMAITEIDLCSNANTNNLREIGKNVFKGCESLQSLTFPDACTQEIYLSSFIGCKSLKWISTRNNQIQFLEDGAFSYEQFRNQVPEEFYFEGLGTYPPTWEYTDDANWDSQIHRMAWKNNFAFSYLTYDSTAQGSYYIKQDHYELTVSEPDVAGGDGKNTFVVNSSNVLERYTPYGNVTSLTIPKRIGPHNVVTVDTGVFENRCNLEKVVVPDTIKTVKTNAFKGCHNLSSVFFDSGDLVIEGNAFKTQDFSGTHTCGMKDEEMTDDKNAPKVKLSFIGPISASSAPFQYAMSSEGRYNAGSQKESYITYYSGWPSNLKVEYDSTAVNPNTNTQGMSVLTDFPSLNDLKTGIIDYSYLTGEQRKEATEAAELYLSGNGSTAGMTENQIQAVDGAVNVVIPEGIQAIAPGLIREKEKDNVTFVGGENSTLPIDMTRATARREGGAGS